jgi:hypothetical protein
MFHHPDLIGRPLKSARAVVIARYPLFYRAGADEALDRPPHVRAGSGLARTEKGFWMVQDDAHWLAWTAIPELNSGLRPPLCEHVMLREGEDGARTFGSDRGNKDFKFDLEAICTVPRTVGFDLMALGSGSSSAREVVVRWDDRPANAEPGLFFAHEYYAALREEKSFSGSDMNIEGVLCNGPQVMLLNRGNGAATAGHIARNTLGYLSTDAFLQWVQGGGISSIPRLEAVALGVLGAIEDAGITWTDLTQTENGVWFSATAERSPNARDDGEVLGSYLGFREKNTVWWITVCDESGKPTRQKLEGLSPGVHDRQFWCLTDDDDPRKAAELLLVELVGV